MVIALRFMFTHQATYVPVVQQNNSSVPSVQSTEAKNNSNSPAVSGAWVKSPVYGIYYPAGYEINEYGYLNASQKGQGLPESSGIPTFSATNGTIILSWGGAQSGCTDTDYGVFKYGATVTCLKGMTAQLGSTNPRNPPISQAEVNIFGDFVQKNQ